MKFEVRQEETTLSLETYELQRALEMGEILSHAKIRHNIYTKGAWVSPQSIPLFANAQNSLVARLSYRLDRPTIPWCTLLIALGVLVGFWMQPPLEIWHLANSWVNFVLEERWSSVLSGVFIHQSKLHLWSNLLLLLYCGYRVEVAIGSPKTGLLFVLSLINGTFLLFLSQEEGYVVGISGFVFGLWVVQIIIGYLFSLPVRHQHKYGWWALFCLFIMLYGNVISNNVSHILHLGGVISGVLVALELKQPKKTLIAYVSLLVGMLLYGYSSKYKGFTTEWDVDGVTLLIPKDFGYASTNNFTIWSHIAQPSGQIIRGEDTREDCALPDIPKQEVISVQQQQDICLITLPDWNVQLYQKRYGLRRIWLMCIYKNDSGDWDEFCEETVQSIRPTEPYRVRQLRELHQKNPEDFVGMNRFASVLEQYGFYEDADRVYVQLEKIDVWKQRVEAKRLMLRDQGYLVWDETFFRQNYHRLDSERQKTLCQKIKSEVCI